MRLLRPNGAAAAARRGSSAGQGYSHAATAADARQRCDPTAAVRCAAARCETAGQQRFGARQWQRRRRRSTAGTALLGSGLLPCRLPACVSAVRDAFISGLPASCCAFPLPPGFSRRAARCLLTGNSPWGTIRMLSRPAPRRPRHHAPPTENGSRPWSAADAARRLSVPRRLESSTPSAPAPVAQLNRAVALLKIESFESWSPVKLNIFCIIPCSSVV